MNKNKKLHPILKIMVALFVVFIALFIANMSGYYESKIREGTTITEDKIKEFEEKIQNGEEIDIEAFLNNDRVDYSNKISNLGEKLTVNIETVFKDGMHIIGNILKSLF